MTRGGYIKRTNPNEYKKQRRGGVGVIDFNGKKDLGIKVFFKNDIKEKLRVALIKALTLIASEGPGLINDAHRKVNATKRAVEALKEEKDRIKREIKRDYFKLWY